jgi:biopolymer transport protein ExbD
VRYGNRSRSQRGPILFGYQHDAVDRRHVGLAKTPQPEVHINVDKFARYEIVAETLADLQYRGLKMIGFVNNGYF